MTNLSRRSLLTGLLGAAGLAALAPIARLLPAVPTPALPATGLIEEVGRYESVRFISTADLQRVHDSLRRHSVRMIDDMYYEILVHENYELALRDLPPKAGGLRFTKNGVEVDPRDYIGPDRVWHSVEEYAV